MPFLVANNMNALSSSSDNDSNDSDDSSYKWEEFFHAPLKPAVGNILDIETAASKTNNILIWKTNKGHIIIYWCRPQGYCDYFWFEQAVYFWKRLSQGSGDSIYHGSWNHLGGLQQEVQCVDYWHYYLPIIEWKTSLLSKWWSQNVDASLQQHIKRSVPFYFEESFAWEFIDYILRWVDQRRSEVYLQCQ